MRLFRRRRPTAICQLCRQTDMGSVGLSRVGDQRIPDRFCDECLDRLKRREIQVDESLVDELIRELELAEEAHATFTGDRFIGKLMWCWSPRVQDAVGAYLVKEPSTLALRVMVDRGGDRGMPYIHEALGRHGAWWKKKTYKRNDADLLGQRDISSYTESEFTKLEPLVRKLGKKAGVDEDVYLVQTLLRIVENPEAPRRYEAMDYLASHCAYHLREHPTCRPMMDDAIARLRQGDAASQPMATRIERAIFRH